MARPSLRREPPPRRLILDSGAVIALARREQRARAFLARALELAVPIEIPVVVVAETVRGKRQDAPVHRVLNAVGAVPPATEATGRIAGRLLGHANSSATVDALVVAQAVGTTGGAQILTSDPHDLEALAEPHPEVWIQRL